MSNIVDNNNIADEIASTTTGEPVITQAPTTPDTQNTSTAADATTADTTTADTATPDTQNATTSADTTTADTATAAIEFTVHEYESEPDLPVDYLSQGYYAIATSGEKYLRPEFVGEYAQIMAALLADMKPSDFSALLRELKRSKKSSFPYEARMTAALELLPKSMQLVSRDKAPSLLISFIKHNIDNIHDDMDWVAFYRHLDAIAGFMSL